MKNSRTEELNGGDALTFTKRNLERAISAQLIANYWVNRTGHDMQSFIHLYELCEGQEGRKETLII